MHEQFGQKVTKSISLSKQIYFSFLILISLLFQMSFYYFLLVSSNHKHISNQPNQAGAYGKSFQPLKENSLDSGQDNSFEIEKAPELPLDLDIVNLQDKYKGQDDVFHVCESTMHKKGSLKKKSVILDSIRKNFSHWGSSFYFTGHGYANGNLCIQTVENPEGESLTIQQILDMMIEEGIKLVQRSKPQIIHPLYFIYIDACYSGRNVLRAQKHLREKKFIGDVEILCSSGPHYKSIVTYTGSLLISADCKDINPRIKQNKDDLAKRFEARKPIKLSYERSGTANEPKVKIEQLKFQKLI